MKEWIQPRWLLGSCVQLPVAADNGRTAEHGVDQLGGEDNQPTETDAEPT
jgi:hypothetical protein